MCLFEHLRILSSISEVKVAFFAEISSFICTDNKILACTDDYFHVMNDIKIIKSNSFDIINIILVLKNMLKLKSVSIQCCHA